MLISGWYPFTVYAFPAGEEGDAKDLAMKEVADSFTASLPRKGSYDFSKDQEKG